MKYGAKKENFATPETRLAYDRQKFFSGFLGEPNSGCWLWMEATAPNGYGNLCLTADGGRKESAHRFSWKIHYGDIPFGIYVCHKCDTPACVRPDHLFLGTHQNNMDDKVAKGRVPRGAAAGVAKLTDEKVMEILKYEESHARAAKKFGVTVKVIKMIRWNRAWKHIERNKK